MRNTLHWIVNRYRTLVNSIAFYPAFIALCFLGLSYLMIHIDFSDTGKSIKANWEWLKLKDASTARTIISVIAAGILSLTVFSFTMVMVILNQAASQMSNRVLDQLIGNRYQQFVLGFYIGTIVYSLFLLSAIRDIDAGIYVPSLSTYLLIAFAIVDIFLFIYFLHYITQSVKYAVIIRKIYKQTLTALKATCQQSREEDVPEKMEGYSFPAHKAGIFEGFDHDALFRLATEEEVMIQFLYPTGTYVLQGAPLLLISPKSKKLTETAEGTIRLSVFIDPEESVSKNFYYGFRQLTEVAIKAMSPGINDPGTAVESIRALITLLDYRLHHFPNSVFRNEKGRVCIISRERTFEEMFDSTIKPVWHYGKQDPFIQMELQHLLQQLFQKEPNSVLGKFLSNVRRQSNNEPEMEP